MHRTLTSLLILAAGAISLQAATLTGTITDSTTKLPIAGAIAVLSYNDGGSGGGGTTQRDTVGTDGVYSFSNFASANYSLTVSAPGYLTNVYTVPMVGISAMTVHVQLLKPVYSSILGTIADSSTGATIPIAAVALRKGASGLGTAFRSATITNGTYSFDSVVAGTYTLTVTADGYLSRTIPLSAAGTNAQTLNVRLVKIGYATIAGRVTDSASGAGIPGTVISYRLTSGVTRSDTSDGQGYYSFDSVLVGGYSFSAAEPLHIGKLIMVTVGGAGTQTVDFRLARIFASSILGTITGPNAQPLPHLVLRLTPFYGGFMRFDTTDAHGAYAFDSVMAGTYLLWIFDTLAQHVYDSTISVWTGGTANETYNVKLRQRGAAVRSAPASAARSSLCISGGVVQLGSTGEAGELRVFGANGRLVSAHSFDAGATTLALPASIRETPGAFYVQAVRRGGAISEVFVVR